MEQKKNGAEAPQCSLTNESWIEGFLRPCLEQCVNLARIIQVFEVVTNLSFGSI